MEGHVGKGEDEYCQGGGRWRITLVKVKDGYCHGDGRWRVTLVKSSQRSSHKGETDKPCEVA